jgi:hypothetical protein
MPDEKEKDNIIAMFRENNQVEKVKIVTELKTFIEWKEEAQTQEERDLRMQFEDFVKYMSQEINQSIPEVLIQAYNTHLNLHVEN